MIRTRSHRGHELLDRLHAELIADPHIDADSAHIALDGLATVRDVFDQVDQAGAYPPLRLFPPSS